MALADAVVGARHVAQQITWTDEDGDPVDLTGATLSGRKRNKHTAAAEALDGSLVVSDASNGVFDWTYGVTDVATAGEFEVQFTATYGAGDLDRTLAADWQVHEAI